MGSNVALYLKGGNYLWGSRLCVREHRGTGLSLTVWETEEQAAAMAERYGPGANPAVGASVVRCEVREVAATA